MPESASPTLDWWAGSLDPAQATEAVGVEMALAECSLSDGRHTVVLVESQAFVQAEKGVS